MISQMIKNKNFGNLDIISFFNSKNFIEIYESFKDYSKYQDILFSSFDLNSLEIGFYNNFNEMLKKNENNLVLKTSFIYETEQIILEFFKNQLLINYSSKLYIKENSDTIKLIKNYIKQNEAITVIGFELSLNPNQFNNSLESHINDKSTYPIIILKNNEVKTFKNNDEVDHIKLEILKSFYNLIV